MLSAMLAARYGVYLTALVRATQKSAYCRNMTLCPASAMLAATTLSPPQASARHLALSKLNGSLPGRVRYLGTPAEESGNGKELMARQNAFDGLDAAMMVHPAGVDLITMPSLAVNEVRVTYTGKAAHASAMPFAGINALDGLVTAYQSIAQLRQHIKQSERIHGIFNEAGLAPNIVPTAPSVHFMCAPPMVWNWPN